MSLLGLNLFKFACPLWIPFFIFKSLHIPNVYSYTLFYFCLQFEFYSLSFLMFFSLKNLNQAIQSIAIFCEKFSEHYKSALHYVPDSMHNCVVFFFVIHTRYWIDITIQKYEVYARWNVAAKCFKICHFLCTYLHILKKKKNMGSP